MEYKQFATKINLHEKKEIDRVQITAYYLMLQEESVNFNLGDVVKMLCDIGSPISNISRLKRNLSKAREFKKANENKYMIVPSIKKQLDAEYSDYLRNNEEIESSSEILDEKLFLEKRGYLDKLIKQINNCYYNNCYDACAVLMRRVFEITLILSYEKLGIADEIKDANGDYFMLERIVANAVQNKTLHISRSRKEYDQIRDLGNFAAHKIHFNTRQLDIDNIKQIYIVCLEELYYKAGLIQ